LYTPPPRGTRRGPGRCQRGPGPQQEIDKTLARQSRRFHERLAKPAFPVPPLIKLMAFRMSRTSMKLMLDGSSRDYVHYSDKGWFESDYYYPTRLGMLKKAVGKLFDAVARSMAKRGTQTAPRTLST
jgi:hypothetical protein